MLKQLFMLAECFYTDNPLVPGDVPFITFQIFSILS